MKIRFQCFLGLAILFFAFALCFTQVLHAFTLIRSDDTFIRNHSLDQSCQGSVGTHFDPQSGAIGAWAEIWEPLYTEKVCKGLGTVWSRAQLNVAERKWVYLGIIHHGNVEVYGTDKSAISNLNLTFYGRGPDGGFEWLNYMILFHSSACQSTRHTNPGFLTTGIYGECVPCLYLDPECPEDMEKLDLLWWYEHTPYDTFYVEGLMTEESETFRGGRFYFEQWYALFLDPGAYSIEYGISTRAESLSGYHDGSYDQGFAFATAKLVSYGGTDTFIPRDDSKHTGAYFLFAESPGGKVNGVIDLTTRQPGELDPAPPITDPGPYYPSIKDLGLMIETYLDEDAIDQQMANAVLSRTENAQRLVDKENIHAAINILQSLINTINAQRGKKISDRAADDCVLYTNNLISWLSDQMAESESY